MQTVEPNIGEFSWLDFQLAKAKVQLRVAKQQPSSVGAALQELAVLKRFVNRRTKETTKMSLRPTQRSWQFPSSRPHRHKSIFQETEFPDLSTLSISKHPGPACPTRTSVASTLDQQDGNVDNQIVQKKRTPFSVEQARPRHSRTALAPMAPMQVATTLAQAALLLQLDEVRISSADKTRRCFKCPFNLV